jgi:hypothetical protein
MLIDVRRKEKLARIVPYEPSVIEPHDSKAVVKGLEDSFLPLARKNMAEHEDRLPLTFDPEILQGPLRGGGAGKVTG